MGEFKGTQGPWKVESGSEKGRWIGNENGYAALSCGKTVNEAMSNAQLISKAPELLEKLDELAEELEFHQVSVAKAKEARELIKQATSI